MKLHCLFFCWGIECPEFSFRVGKILHSFRLQWMTNCCKTGKCTAYPGSSLQRKGSKNLRPLRSVYTERVWFVLLRPTPQTAVTFCINPPLELSVLFDSLRLQYLNSLYAMLSKPQKITYFWAESAFYLICVVMWFFAR